MSIISIDISPATIVNHSPEKGTKTVRLKRIQEDVKYRLSVVLWEPGRVNLFRDDGQGWKLWMEWTNPEPKAWESKWNSGEIPVELKDIPQKIYARLKGKSETGGDEIAILKPV